MPFTVNDVFVFGYLGCIALGLGLSVTCTVAAGVWRRRAERVFPIVALLGLVLLVLAASGVGGATGGGFERGSGDARGCSRGAPA